MPQVWMFLVSPFFQTAQTVHSPLLFRKTVEIKRYALWGWPYDFKCREMKHGAYSMVYPMAYLKWSTPKTHVLVK